MTRLRQVHNAHSFPQFFFDRRHWRQGNTLRSLPNIVTELNCGSSETIRGTRHSSAVDQVFSKLPHHSPSHCGIGIFSAEHIPAASANPLARLHTSKSTQIREAGFASTPSNSGIISEPSRLSATIDDVKNTSRIEICAASVRVALRPCVSPVELMASAIPPAPQPPAGAVEEGAAMPAACDGVVAAQVLSSSHLCRHPLASRGTLTTIGFRAIGPSAREVRHRINASVSITRATTATPIAASKPITVTPINLSVQVQSIFSPFVVSCVGEFPCVKNYPKRCRAPELPVHQRAASGIEQNSIAHHRAHRLWCPVLAHPTLRNRAMTTTGQKQSSHHRANGFPRWPRLCGNTSRRASSTISLAVMPSQSSAPVTIGAPSSAAPSRPAASSSSCFTHRRVGACSNGSCGIAKSRGGLNCLNSAASAPQQSPRWQSEIERTGNPSPHAAGNFPAQTSVACRADRLSGHTAAQACESRSAGMASRPDRDLVSAGSLFDRRSKNPVRFHHRVRPQAHSCGDGQRTNISKTTKGQGSLR